MPSASATDLITRALRLLGVVDPTETPQAEYLAVGKVALDDFVDALGLERAAIFSIARTVHPLSSGVASYTIGTGGTFNRDRPIWIDRVSVIPDRAASPVVEVPLGTPLTMAEYQGLSVKSTAGTHPTTIYYDYANAAGLGTIAVYPVPSTSAADLVLYTPSAPSAFADLGTTYILPRGWSRMYRYNLAVELAEEFDRPITARVDRIAKESLAAIKHANFRPTVAALDPATPGLRVPGRFDLYTGGY